MPSERTLRGMRQRQALFRNFLSCGTLQRILSPVPLRRQALAALAGCNSRVDPLCSRGRTGAFAFGIQISAKTVSGLSSAVRSKAQFGFRTCLGSQVFLFAPPMAPLSCEILR